MARYLVLFEVFFDTINFESKTVTLVTELDFLIQGRLNDREYTNKYLTEKLNMGANVVSYGVKDIKCIDVPILEQRILALEEKLGLKFERTPATTSEEKTATVETTTPEESSSGKGKETEASTIQ